MIGHRWSATLAPITFASTLMLVVGCASTTEMRYYTLGDGGSSATSAADSARPTIRVERLVVAEPYSDRRIVYRPSAIEVAYWEFQRWAEPPDKMITARLASNLSASGLFQSVDSFPYSWERADMVLRGVVLAFEEIDGEDGWYGHVEMFLELVDRDAEESLWSSRFEAERKAERKDPDAVVEALAGALDEIAAEVEARIENVLRRRE